MNDFPDDFYAKINKVIEEANKKQTLIIKAEIETIKDALKEEQHKRKEIEHKYNLLKNKYENLEKSIIKNNIIIFGLENTQEALVDYIIRSLNTLLGIDLVRSDINDVFTIGQKSQNKPIIVKFTSYIKKREVLRNCSKLKQINTNKSSKIIIAEQLSPEGIRKQKVLRKHLSEAKARKFNAYIKGERLYINGDPYTVEELEEGNKNNENIDESTETEENENINTRKINSAPATPTIKNKDIESEAEEEEEISKIILRKSKVVPGSSIHQTSNQTKTQEKTKLEGTPKTLPVSKEPHPVQNPKSFRNTRSTSTSSSKK